MSIQSDGSASFRLSTAGRLSKFGSTASSDGTEEQQARQDMWAMSTAKRQFDVALILLASPVLLPLFFAVAALIACSSPQPVLFLQKRIGQNGRRFTIVKFRTMTKSRRRHMAIAAANDAAILPLGRFLRRWKLDELPQFLNVLRGEMSLVGPRPKVPQQQHGELTWRPGITGAATIAFADEEVLFARVPKADLEAYFRDFVIPLKQQIDAQYMAQSTPLSDLKLLFRTAFRRW